MPVFHHTVPDDPPMLRLDAYCAQVFDAFQSRNQARKAIKSNRVLVDGEHARTDWFPKPGWIIEAKVAPNAVLPVLKVDLEVPYQDDHLAVVVNRPA